MDDPWALVADPGVDDAVAMAVLAGMGVVPDLVVAVPGNVGLPASRRNAAGMVALLGWDVPVRTWDGPVRYRRASLHGTGGLGGQSRRLPEGVVAGPVDELPENLLVTGPLSAVAGVPRIDRLVWMGGAVDRSGNVSEVAEFNAWCDPAAVDRVLADHAGVTRIVPLDVTAQVPVTADDLAGGATADLLAEALRAAERVLVHDAVTAVAWVRPELFVWERRPLSCEPTGALVPSPDRVPVEVALGLDADAVRAAIRDAVAACP